MSCFYLEDFFPCVNNLEERILHDHGDEWQENKCKKCACQNGTTTCDVTVCGGIPHESCVEKYTSVDQCCPEYECGKISLYRLIVYFLKTNHNVHKLH